MSSCTICLDILKSPVALPCGHVFCHECVAGIVQSVKPFATQHPCPTCRRPFTILSVDSSLIPPQLRVHVTPPIRKLYLEQPVTTEPEHSDPPSPVSKDAFLAQLKAENDMLRHHCEAWRNRAEMHGNVTLGLAGMARMARNRAVQMQKERDDLQVWCDTLKRKLEESEATAPPSPISSVRMNEDDTPPSKRPRLTSQRTTHVETTRRHRHSQAPVITSGPQAL